ncbi:shikimate dehydrogenase family protein [Hephaestia sp. GCM10023244]|uniref:shikimate dehydrogenase family protein n=1 Tax=unclassified Hephaestia TaxID=2631281 RepID=UPI0020771F5A|nr:shikimate dehydrogenase [Hephaestia sp. MAHUQ-44]MCM8731158.1 shikimate dehydrogenase [Hephaestia sp. MAHUQ-44]
MSYAEVIGDPIKHTKSPVIHNFWLDALGLDASYRATHVTPEGLAAFFDERRADPAWRGCNITLPHKQAALDLIEDRGGVRDTIGAVNTVFRAEDGALVGTNTDAGGFFAPIAELDLEGAPVVVVGAGGAARAILFALSKMQVGRVTLLNRSPLKGAALLASFGLKGEALPLDAKLPPAALLVNTSPLGMVGQPPLVLDLAPLPDDAVVYDIVYAPLETELLAQARARDLDTVDGLDMLVGQAALGFEIFFGATPPRDRDDELRALLTV